MFDDTFSFIFHKKKEHSTVFSTSASNEYVKVEQLLPLKSKSVAFLLLPWKVLIIIMGIRDQEKKNQKIKYFAQQYN